MELHFVTLVVPAIVYCRQWRTHINKPSVLLFAEGAQICFLLLEIKKDVIGEDELYKSKVQQTKIKIYIVAVLILSKNPKLS